MSDRLRARLRPRRRGFTGLRGFFAAVPWLGIACAATDFTVPEGARCRRNSDCSTEHCERGGREGERICCAIECVPGTVCASDGSRCVTCDPEVESCGSPRIEGERCTSGAQCASGNCVPDPGFIARCCEAGCTNLCDPAGSCLDHTLEAPGTSGGGSGRSPLSPSEAIASGGTPFPPTLPAGGDTGGAGASPSTSGGRGGAGAGSPAGATGGFGSGGTTNEPEPAGPACGNGRLDAGESCDEGPDNEDGRRGRSNTDCEISECTTGEVRACAESGAQGNCALGEQRCEGGRFGECSIEPESEDSCAVSGDDANCNGVPNEGCPCVEGDELPCGPAIEQGICRKGVSVCEGGRLSECRGAVLPAPRNCASREDNDCDGRPDDTLDAVCACDVGATEPCDAHPGHDGVGPCRAGTRTCELANDGSSRWGACTGAVAPASSDSCTVSGDDANCNGIPNDPCELPGDPLWTFDSSLEGWGIRLTDPSRLSSNSLLSLDRGAGFPKPGALTVACPFDGGNQKIEVNVPLDPVLDATNRVFRARVRLVSGLSTDTNAPGGIKLFAKSGSGFVYISGRWRYLTKPGEWQDVVLDPRAPDLTTGAFDARDIREFGFELRTFADTKNVSPAVVQLDSVSF